MSRKYREYTYEEWKKALDMYKAGLGPTKISRILGIPVVTVISWVYHGKIPPAARWVAEPSNELGYVIGVIHGDGSVIIERNNYDYKICLGTIDKEFATTFSRAISRLLGRNYHEPWWNKKGKEWRVEYRSKAFYLWYKKIDEEGLEGFKPYIEHSKDTIKYYLRGLYDSEGNNNRNKQIFLYNSNKEMLRYVQYLLKKYFNIVATGPYLDHKAGNTIIINGVEIPVYHDCYKIKIGRKLHIQKFLREIGFSIVRKQRGLKKHEKVFVEGKYMEPYELVKLGLFKLPFNN